MAQSPQWVGDVPSSTPIQTAQSIAEEQKPKKKREKVAIITSGTLQRYFLGHATKGLIEPLVKQGHSVDYFLTLYAGRFESFNPHGNDFLSELSGIVESVKQLIRGRVSQAGANIHGLEISQEVVFNEDDEHLLNTSRLAAKRNLVWKDKKLEELWNRLEAVEIHKGPYTTVIFINDDSVWLKPFDLDRLHNSSSRKAPEGYLIDCSLQMHGKTGWMVTPPAVTDHIYVVDRELAEPFGKQYSLLLNDSKYKLALGDEIFVGDFIKRQKMVMHRRPVDLIPMQRGGHQRSRENGQVDICLHKLCDGEWWHDGVHYEYMRPLKNIKACDSLKLMFDRVGKPLPVY